MGGVAKNQEIEVLGNSYKNAPQKAPKLTQNRVKTGAGTLPKTHPKKVRDIVSKMSQKWVSEGTYRDPKMDPKMDLLLVLGPYGLSWGSWVPF